MSNTRRNAQSAPGKTIELSAHDRPKFYETGDNDSWPKHEIDWASFYAELEDLRFRYGGVSFDGSPRIRVHVTDLEKEYHHQYLDVKKIDETTSMKDALDRINMAEGNIEVATRQLHWTLTDLKYLVKK